MHFVIDCEIGYVYNVIKVSNSLNNVSRCSILDSNIHKRLTFEIDLARNTKDIEKKKALANQALGAVQIAVEFGLITYIEFEKYISSIFNLL